MKFEKTSVYNFEGAIRGMRNPLESWDKSDSYIGYDEWDQNKFVLGKEDLRLAQTLIKGGSEERKFMRMIHVCVDIDMPRYWWSEADTYGFNTKNSCSTMHRLLNNNKPITKEMFVVCEEDNDVVDIVIDRLEKLRQEYKQTKDYKTQTRLLVRAKRLLPEGFLQMRTFDSNYEEIRNMYFQRRKHRLGEEWIETFCKWVESLPYSRELIMIKQSVLVHELGHALCLDDDPYESDKTIGANDSIMNYERDRTIVLVPKQDDVKGVTYAYTGDKAPGPNNINKLQPKADYYNYGSREELVSDSNYVIEGKITKDRVTSIDIGIEKPLSLDYMVYKFEKIL
jgi:hypothetical protein